MATFLSKPVTLSIAPATPAPSWVKSLTGGGAWAEITNSPVMRAWVGANISPSSGYTGYGPIESIREGYNSPIFDPVAKKFALFGGGHGSGSINAVVTFDPATLSYAIPVPPTPPSKYPPLFASSAGALTYPSGSSNGFFQSIATLTDATDLPYAAPFAARPASHVYQAASFANGIFSIHYNSVGNADANLGIWTYLNINPYGSQLLALRAAYDGSAALQQGTKCVYDPLLGKDWVTNVAGDIGDNGRGHLLLVDRITHVIEAAIKVDIDSQGVICIAGDHVYVFAPSYKSGGVMVFDYGMRVHRFTRAVEYLRFSGPSLPTMTPTSVRQETVPIFFDGTNIRFWNYGNAADIDAFYILNLTPTGNVGGWLTMAVTREQRATSNMPTPAFTYTVDFIPDWGVAMILPDSNSRWWAIKI